LPTGSEKEKKKGNQLWGYQPLGSIAKSAREYLGGGMKKEEKGPLDANCKDGGRWLVNSNWKSPETKIRSWVQQAEHKNEVGKLCPAAEGNSDP